MGNGYYVLKRIVKNGYYSQEMSMRFCIEYWEMSFRCWEMGQLNFENQYGKFSDRKKM